LRYRLVGMAFGYVLVAYERAPVFRNEHEMHNEWPEIAT